MAKVNKVNPNKDSGSKKEKKDKGKVDFVMENAKCRDKDGKVVSAVNKDGLLIAVPMPIKEGDSVVYAGYDPRRHLPLKKGHFASMVTYIRYQAYVARVKAAILVKSAEEKEKKAANIEKFGDEETRKKAQKLARLREAAKLLEEQLKADGANVDDI
jgi:hypothetical protein